MLHFSNTIKFGVVLLCLLFVNNSLFAQFWFTDNGQLVEVPKPPLKKADNYCIRLTSDQSKNEKNLKRVKLNIEESAALISSGERQGKEKRLYDELIELYSFFVNSDLSCAKNYLQTLRENYSIDKDYNTIKHLKNLLPQADPVQDTVKNPRQSHSGKPGKNDTRSQPAEIIISDCTSPECLCAKVPDKIERIAVIERELTELRYRKRFAQELFYDFSDEEKNSLFTTNTDKLSIFFKKAGQDIDQTFLPDSVSFLTNYKVNEQTLYANPGEKSNYYYSGEFTAGRKLNFTLKSVDPFKALLLNWHNKTERYLDKNLLCGLKQKLDNDKSLDSAIKASEQKSIDTAQKKDINTLYIIYKNLVSYDNLWSKYSQICRYLREWYWYSGGNFSLNYIDLIHEDEITQIQKELKPLQEEEKRLKAQVSKIESIINCIECRENGLDTLKRMQDSFAVKSAALTEVQNKGKELKSSLEKFLKETNNFKSVSRVLHDVNLPVQAVSRKQSIIYHDASVDLEIKRQCKSRLNDNVLPDNYDVYFGLINCNKPEGEFTITEVQEIFNDSAAFTRELSSAIKPLAAAAIALNPYAKGMSLLLDESFGSFGTKKHEKKEGGGEPDKYSLMLDALAYKIWRIKLLQKMLEEYCQKPTPKELEEKAADTSYYTYAIKAKKWAAPYTNNYTINRDGKPIANEQYSIGRQKLIALGAGIFFNTRSARQQTIDTTGNSFNINNSDSRAKFVVGLKIYPWKAFEAEGSIYPRFPLKRLHLFTGFEITKPLENLYGGIGYDIVPGLEISGGVHVYRRDAYSLRNGQVIDKTNTYKASGAYWGVTIDPLVLVEVLKTIL